MRTLRLSPDSVGATYVVDGREVTSWADDTEVLMRVERRNSKDLRTDGEKQAWADKFIEELEFPNDFELIVDKSQN